MIDAVLAELRAAFDDPATGLAAQVRGIETTRGVPANSIATDYAWERWSLADVLQPANSVRAALAPMSMDAEWRPLQTGERRALHRLRLTFERVAADIATLEDGLTADVSAAIKVLDNIPRYTAAHGGAIALVDGSIAVRFGSFGGPPTARGCILDFTVLEVGQE